MRNPNDLYNCDVHVFLESLNLDMDDKLMSYYFNEEIYKSYDTKILDELYENMTVNGVVKLQTHLLETLKQKLPTVLVKYPKDFFNGIGCYLYRQFHIELEPGA